MKHHILDKTFWVYTAIAVACWCVGTGLMFLLYNCLHVGYWIASACNYLVGGTMSYFLNRKYTFHSHDNRLRLLAKYVLHMVVCYFVSYSLAPVVTKFVLDVMTSYGLNACPPLLVGVGIGTSVEVAALQSKKALMRRIGSHNPNPKAAKMERLLEDGINAIGLGPQGLRGKNSVLGVNIENSARHPSVIGVAVNVGCWSHRRGHIVFDKELNYTIDSHSEVDF